MKTKYKGATIVDIPTEKFPEMVLIEKTTKRVKELFGKRFVNFQKACSMIDMCLSEEYIERTKIDAFNQKDLRRL